MDSGSRITFRGKGNAGLRGAQAGDLKVVINVLPHDVFQRRGKELVRETPLPFSTAALGGKITVPTLDGEAEIAIPPGTQNGQVFRVRGQGMPDVHDPRRGDLHVVVAVAIPTDLTPRQRELLLEYAKERGENIDHKGKNVFQRVKEAVEDVIGDHHDTPRETLSD